MAKLNIEGEQGISTTAQQATTPLFLKDTDEIDFRHTLDLLLSGKWIVLGVTIAAIVISIAYLSITPPTYQTDGLVQVEEDKKSGSASDLGEVSSLLLGSPVQTEAELQILKSRMVLTQVVENLKLSVTATPRTFPLVGSAYFRSQKNLTGPLQVPSWLRKFAWGGEEIEVSTFSVPDRYLNSRWKLTTLVDGYELADEDGRKILEGKVGELASASFPDGSLALYVRELKAYPGTEFVLIRRALQDVLSGLGGSLIVAERGRQSGVIGITFSGYSAPFVAKVVNSIEDAYLKQNVERRSAEAERSLEFLEKQIPLAKEKVNSAQQQLNSYQLQHGSVDVNKETDLLLQHSVELETTRLTLAQQREEALQRFTTQHPVIRSIDEKLRSIEEEEQKLKGQSQKLPTTQQEILSLVRDLDVANQLYTAMLNSVQQLQVSRAGTVGNVRIVDYALPPRKPSGPKVFLVLTIGLVSGLFLGSIFVLIQRVLLRGVDDPAEVETRLGLAAYAAVPYTQMQRQLAQKLEKGESGSHFLSTISGSDLAVEALRSLRNSLPFLMLESGNNVVMLSGPSPGIGKSFVTANIGALLALSGKKTVIVDADLRLGHLYKYSGLSASPGLSEYVAGSLLEEEVIRPAGTDGLMMVTNGVKPPNPAELLLHERFAKLVQYLSSRFDYVIIDTPPSLLVADAAVVGRMAGCTLLVLKSAEHPMREVEECYRRLAQAGANVRGVIFNQVGRHIGSYGYGGYGYSYKRDYKYE